MILTIIILDFFIRILRFMQIHIQENKKEIKEHGNYSFPVNISVEEIQSYETCSFLWHWHPEIELTLILSGEIEYLADDKTYRLSADGLFCNSNILHSGHMIGRKDCTYLSVTFHPRFLYGYENSILHSKYVRNIVSNSSFSSLALRPSVDWQKEIIELLNEIYQIHESSSIDFELEFQIKLLHIWKKLYSYFSTQSDNKVKAKPSLDRLREIITFIESHYFQDICLEDVANAANICKSECCRFFKKHMNMTIFDYLLYVRIQKSLPLLTSSGTITEVASQVGFASPSYYSQIFKRYMKCTPMEYKKEAL